MAKSVFTIGDNFLPPDEVLTALKGTASLDVPAISGFGVYVEETDQLVQILDAEGHLSENLLANLSSNPSAPTPVPSLTLTTPPSGTIPDLVKGILNQSNKYTLVTWFPATFGTGVISSLGGVDEAHVRPACAASLGVASAIATGTYDPSITTVTLAAAQQRTIDVLTVIFKQHVSNGGPWGGVGTASLTSGAIGWQTGLWAELSGLAGWFLWSALPASAQQQCLNMVIWEANRMIGWKLPYYKNPDGTTVTQGDSKSEEVCWDAAIVSLACAMQPQHQNVPAWVAKLCEMGVATFSRLADFTSADVSHGSPVADLLDGFNANPDGSIVNHGAISPDYTVSGAASGMPLISLFAAAGMPTPAALQRSANSVYASLITSTYSTNYGYNAPGGTIYVPDSADIYYPSLDGWGTQVVMDKAAFDVLADTYGWDEGLATPAATWAQLHLERQADLQARFTTGQTFTTGDLTEDSYAGREQWIGHHAGLSMLVLAAPKPRFSNATPAALANRIRSL